jgi:PPOX class probable F420-dependent enzyme
VPLYGRGDGWHGRGVDLDEARAYVRENSHAVLSTVRKDGTPQMSPVAVAVDAQGRGVVSSRETAFKTKNLRRDPRAWLCVFPDAFYGRWVQVEGTVEVLSLPEALEPLVEYYRAVAGEHEDWDEYRRAMVAEQRCLLQVTLVRAGPDRAG